VESLDEKINTFSIPISDLYLSVRSSNCLKIKGIKYVGDLVQLNGSELLRIGNFGRKSLEEIKKKLAELNLSLGMKIEGWSLEEDKGKITYVTQEEILKRKSQKIIKEKTNNLLLPIEALGLSSSSTDYLAKMKVNYVGDLVQLKENTLLKSKYFRKKSFEEVEASLAVLGLSLGMKIKGWPPRNLLEFSQKYKQKILEKDKEEAIKFRKSIKVEINYLEDELFYIFISFARTDRDKLIVAKFYGWDGSGKHTLEEIGKSYNLTRERVRQIISKFIRTFRLYKKRRVGYLPVIDSVLKCISDNLPNLAENIENKLVKKNLTKTPFKLDGILTALDLLKRPIPFSIIKIRNTRIAVSPRYNSIPKLILQTAKKSITHWGASTVTDIIEQIKQITSKSVDRNIVISILSLRRDLIWLDSSKEWFWLSSVPRNRLLNQIEKILSVCNKIEISELRSGVRRHYRMEGFSPPRDILLNFCQKLSICKVDGNIIIPDSTLNWEKILPDAERIIFSVLKEHGPIMSRTNFKEKCLSYGISEDSFNVRVSYSPIIVKYAMGVYGLRGACVQPGVIESLKTKKIFQKTTIDYGWTDDGKIWVGIRITKSMLEIGIFLIPGGMKKYLQGDFSFHTADGADLGIIRIKESSAWNIRPLLKRRGGEEDDYIVLVFDIGSHEVIGYIGDIDLLDDFRLTE